MAKTNNVHGHAPNGEDISIACTITHQITKSRIADLLTSAIEGGSNYWYCIDKSRCQEPVQIDPDILADEGQVYFHIHWPLSEGGSLCFFDRESEEDDREYWMLNLEAIKRGLQVMAEKYPHHFVDFVSENDDANTGDCFLQCCLFGKEVFA